MVCLSGKQPDAPTESHTQEIPMFDTLQPAVIAFFIIAAISIAAAVVGLVVAFRDSRTFTARPVVAIGGRVAVESDVRRAA
jgi:LPS O-antigen subunit length determinant protein (WzzB/FepE family)